MWPPCKSCNLNTEKAKLRVGKRFGTQDLFVVDCYCCFSVRFPPFLRPWCARDETKGIRELIELEEDFDVGCLVG